MKIVILKVNEISTTLLKVNKISVKWWHNQIEYTCDAINFDTQHFVWYVHFYKLEIAYEQFRS